MLTRLVRAFVAFSLVYKALRPTMSSQGPMSILKLKETNNELRLHVYQNTMIASMVPEAKFESSRSTLFPSFLSKITL